MNSINLATESKSTYAYKFKICGYGGKYTIGTISNETAIYWSKLGDGLLERFISTYDREVIIEKYSIPEKYHENLGWSWTDFSDISDAYGPFLEIGSTMIEVYDARSNSDESIFSVKITEDMIESRKFPDKGIIFPNKQLVYGFELDDAIYKLNLDYEEIAEMAEPFDPSKLKISTSIWDAMGQEREIIEEIKYGDEYLGIEEEDDADNKERDGEVSWNL